MKKGGGDPMSNRLQHELSPYLLQHAQNPVDWYPWGEEALGRAERENKPIFLSIGYSACHWCHVMEHESFEDATIAEQLNENFVCIKVDREERPDLDQIYMTAVQIMTGRGGWPMSVFLTPERQPFFGGTYWPPKQRMGMPGFDQVIAAVKDAWENRQELAYRQAEQLTERIAAVGLHDQGETQLTAGLLDGAVLYLQRAFDGTHGGFGSAPKFPHAMDLQLLLRIRQRKGGDQLLRMVGLTLDKMAAGGIYDHLGGGFARYSVDDRWLVPHFEKMLYDNALLGAAYLDSFLATGNAEHQRVVRETLDYVLRDMTDAAGGFYSTEDADSEGVEGKYYVWNPSEVEEVLGVDVARRFCLVYDVTPEGNFEGHSILNLPKRIEQVAQLHGWPLEELQTELAASRDKLLACRSRRVRPGKDDKVIVSWNGLMIDTMARAARGLNEPRYQQAATRAAEFLHAELWRDGRLLHCWRHGTSSLAAYLDDYTTLANALVSLYEASFEVRWLDWAVELMDQVLERFRDPEGGALFYTADDHEQLITRTKDLQDSSVPSGNAMAATTLVRLGHLTQRTDYLEQAEAILRSAGRLLEDAPAAAGQSLLALDLLLGPLYQITIVGDLADADAAAAIRDLNGRYVPRSVIAHSSQGSTPPSPHLARLFEGREQRDDQTTFHVCQNQTCWAPSSAKEAIETLWPQLTSC
jgi:uncharacterized protein YyaL (SSP411 family)